jgi:hypothetical protein
MKEIRKEAIGLLVLLVFFFAVTTTLVPVLVIGVSVSGIWYVFETLDLKHAKTTVRIGAVLLCVLYLGILWFVFGQHPDYAVAYTFVYVCAILLGSLLIYRKLKEKKNKMAIALALGLVYLVVKLVLFQFVGLKLVWPAMDMLINH